MRDVPGWVVEGEDHQQRLDEFYRLMRFWWRLMLCPKLPFRIMDVVRANGRWGGVHMLLGRLVRLGR